MWADCKVKKEHAVSGILSISGINRIDGVVIHLRLPFPESLAPSKGMLRHTQKRARVTPCSFSKGNSLGRTKPAFLFGLASTGVYQAG